MAVGQNIFERLTSVIIQQESIIKQLTEKLEKLEVGNTTGGGGGGGGGNASIEDYVSGKQYTRNVLVVDPETETVYRVLDSYTSITVEEDCGNGHLKLVGFESQVVTIGHNPTQAEIDALPDNSLVAVYSPTDTPYVPEDSGY